MRKRAVLLLPMIGLACRGPTVGIEAPDKPIVLNINVTVQQDVRVHLEDDVKKLLDSEGGVGTRDVGDAPDPALGRELFASEPEVAAARAAGRIGERYDGLLGVVKPPADGATQKLVDSVNAARLAAYQDIAKQRGAPLADVRALAAKARIEGAPAGTWVMLDAGAWRRK